MARPRIREGGFGFIPQPARIARDKDGTISDATLGLIASQLDTVTKAINGGLRLRAGGNLGRAGNFNAQLVEFITPGMANQQFLVPHSMQEAPEGYIIVLQNKAGSIYTSNFGGWDGNSVYFKSDATDMLVNAILYT